VFSCLALLSSTELLSCLFFVTFGFVYSRDIFCVEEFPLQRPDGRVIYCNGLLYVFPTRNIVNFLINFTFELQHTYQRHDIAYLS